MNFSIFVAGKYRGRVNPTLGCSLCEQVRAGSLNCPPLRKKFPPFCGAEPATSLPPVSRQVPYELPNKKWTETRPLGFFLFDQSTRKERRWRHVNYLRKRVGKQHNVQLSLCLQLSLEREIERILQGRNSFLEVIP